MLKKIILGLLLTGFIGVLIWGGINRTLAKGGESTRSGNQNWTEDHHSEDCEEDGTRGSFSPDIDNSAVRGQNQGHEFSVVSANENGNQPEPESEPLSFALADDTSYRATSQGQGQSRGNGGQGNGGGGGREPLDAAEVEALYLALNDEYYALAVYRSVIDSFGPVEPFVGIAASEENHIAALVNQLTKHDLAVPENSWLGAIPPFESVEQACATGVQAEIDNAELYDQLFSMTDDAALIRVFTNLSNASLNSHLPQLEDCQ